MLSAMLPRSVSTIYYHAPLPVYYPFKMGNPSMRDTFDLIREYCGEVCDTTIGPSGRGKYFDVVEKQIDCDRLFSNDFIEGWAAQTIEAAPPPVLESLVLACHPFYFLLIQYSTETIPSVRCGVFLLQFCLQFLKGNCSKSPVPCCSFYSKNASQGTIPSVPKNGSKNAPHLMEEIVSVHTDKCG